MGKTSSRRTCCRQEVVGRRNAGGVPPTRLHPPRTTRGASFAQTAGVTKSSRRVAHVPLPSPDPRLRPGRLGAPGAARERGAIGLRCCAPDTPLASRGRPKRCLDGEVVGRNLTTDGTPAACRRPNCGRREPLAACRSRKLRASRRARGVSLACRYPPPDPRLRPGRIGALGAARELGASGLRYCGTRHAAREPRAGKTSSR